MDCDLRAGKGDGGPRAFLPRPESVHLLSRQPARRPERHRERPEPIPVAGGNIVVAGQYFLIATSTKLIAYGPGKAPPVKDEPLVTRANDHTRVPERASPLDDVHGKQATRLSP